jgi:hypothetical protein
MKATPFKTGFKPKRRGLMGVEDTHTIDSVQEIEEHGLFYFEGI